MRDATALFRQQASIQNRDKQLVALLELEHPQFETLRFVSDVSDIVSNGWTYRAFPFGFSFPGEAERVPTASLTIQNVTKEIGTAIAQVKGPISARLSAVLRSQPDLIVADAPRMLLQNVSVTNAFVSGTLTGRRRSNAQWPGIRATPDLTPGLHWS